MAVGIAPFVRAHSVQGLSCRQRRITSLTVGAKGISRVPSTCTKQRRRTNNVAIKVERMTRDFVFNNIHLPDPNPELPIEKVREIHAMTYPEISTAAVEGPEILGNRLRYTFSRAVGTKG